jgi:hypothetical protein
LNEWLIMVCKRLGDKTAHCDGGSYHGSRDDFPVAGKREASRHEASQPAMRRRSFLLAAGAGLAGVGLAGVGLAGGFVAPASCWAEEESVARAKVRLPSVEEIRGRSPDLWQLVDLINAYRQLHDLPVVDLSPRMTAVAWLHCRDLEANKPHQQHGSLHSWSADMRWSGGAYRPKDKSTWPLMWDKPKEIAAYQGYGFEVAASEIRDRRHALEVWQQSQPHNNVLLNRDIWSQPRWQWKALGAVYYKGYATAWFGDKPDPP